jgi:hypothetical protein
MPHRQNFIPAAKTSTCSLIGQLTSRLRSITLLSHDIRPGPCSVTRSPPLCPAEHTPRCTAEDCGVPVRSPGKIDVVDGPTLPGPSKHEPYRYWPCGGGRWAGVSWLAASRASVVTGVMSLAGRLCSPNLPERRPFSAGFFQPLSMQKADTCSNASFSSLKSSAQLCRGLPSLQVSAGRAV